jgi:hypothetical protein
MGGAAMTIRIAARTAIVLGVISLVAGGVSALALTDIWHGEADLRLEWRALQVAAILIFAFHVAALSTLRRVLRTGV